MSPTMARKKAVRREPPAKAAAVRRRKAKLDILELAMRWPGESFIQNDQLHLVEDPAWGPLYSLTPENLDTIERMYSFEGLPPAIRVLLTIPEKTRRELFEILAKRFPKEIQRLKWEGGRGPKNIGDQGSKHYPEYQKFLEYQRNGWTAPAIADAIWPPDKEYGPEEWKPEDPVQLIRNWRRLARKRGDLPPLRR